MKPVGDQHHHHGLHSPTKAINISIPFSSGEAALLGKGRHKTWALAAIALLALWSMFAAFVTLRWRWREREKLARRVWDVYTRTGDRVRLPRFWQEAFEAAYEELAGVW